MQNIAISQWDLQLMPENTCKAWETIWVKMHTYKHNYYPYYMATLNKFSVLKCT